VWAFDVGGVSETLKNDVSGCLFPFPETEFMSASIQKYFQEGELARMGDEAFDFVRTRFSSAMMTEAYLKAYSLII